MTPDAADGYTRTVTALALDAQGRLLACIVTTDQESFHSALRPVDDISVPMAGAEIPALYQGNFWITALAVAASGAVFACDADGAVHDNATGAWRVTPVTPGRALKAIACLPDGTVLTGGTAGRVHRARAGAAYEPVEPECGTWINALAGSGGDDFLAIGDEGTVFEWQGGTGRRVEIATDLLLHDALVDGDAYLICGERGLLLRGRGDVWQDLGRGGPDLFGLARYQGRLWAAAGGEGVLDLEGDAITPVRQTFNAYVIRTNGRFAAFAGDAILARYDGRDWFGYRFG